MNNNIESRAATVCAYSAGLIDGEGCIQISGGKQKGYLQAHIEVTTCDEHLPGFMHRHWGGSSSPRTVSGNRRGAVQWQLTGVDNIEPFMLQLLPYLTLKAPQADLMVEWCRSRRAMMKKPRGQRGYTERERQIFTELRSLHYSRLK